MVPIPCFPSRPFENTKLKRKHVYIYIYGMYISHLLCQVEVGLSDLVWFEPTKQQGITCKVNPNIAPVRKASFKRHSFWMCHDPLCPERLQQAGPAIWGIFGTYSPINHLPHLYQANDWLRSRMTWFPGNKTLILGELEPDHSNCSPLFPEFWWSKSDKFNTILNHHA